MKSTSAVRRGFVAGSVLLAMAVTLSCSTARAQDRDDDRVVAQVLSGNFEELRSLEAQSDRGVPFAMYWWGVFLDNCIFDRCDQAAARALYLRAALAGHSGATAELLGYVQSYAELDDLVAMIGVPDGGVERMIYLLQLTLLSRAGPPSESTPERDSQARAEFLAIATQERQLGLLVGLVVLDGPVVRDDELRAIANSGYPLSSDMVRQRDILTGEYNPGATGRGIVEHAQAGDLGTGAAYCDSALTSAGLTVLPAGLLEVCERAAKAGFPGAVRALIYHHHFKGNMRAAEYFVGLCDALIGFLCANAINEYYTSRRVEGAELTAREALWDLAATNMSIAQLLDSGLLSGQEKEEFLAPPGDLRRALFVLRVRTQIIIEACLTTRLDPSGDAIAANPRCPWRKPIAIPAEFLSGTR